MAGQARTAVPPRIPGVVDGTVTVSVDPDGSITFHVVVGAADGASPDHDHQVEVVIWEKDAGRLGRLLGGSDREPLASLPCLVGVRLGRFVS